MSYAGTDNMTLAKLNAMLNKAGFDDAEIARGLRLKTSGMQKLSQRLGVDVQEASHMLDQLITKLRDDENRLAENYRSMMEGSRYGMERDRLGNVTVRDSHSGKEIFLRGATAAELLKAVKLGDEQEILAGYLTENVTEATDEEEETYADEIKADRGSYNFPWVYERQQGTGTAEYTGRGDTFKIKLVSVRDAEGNEIDAVGPMQSSLTNQAFKFIGQV